MINWLINSTLCSGMLLAFYHVVLKNTSLFGFNRLYLLFSLMFSLLVPLIVIQQQHTAVLPDAAFTTIPYYTSDSAPINPTYQAVNVTALPAHINYIAEALIVAYAIVASLLFFRFARNLYTIMTEAASNDKVRQNTAWLVLTDNDLVPHTFLNYIFLNKQAYKQNGIEKSLLDHELAHATQYHSVDVVCIGLLQAIFWFNPFLFLYRKAIQLNHEFIADAAAIKQTETIGGYQQLLISKISLLPGSSIASQFNYSITKKRLIMMTKHTSAKATWFIRLMMIPVMAAAFLLFCGKSQAQQVQDSSKKPGAKDKTGNSQPPKPSGDAGVMVRFDGLKYPSMVNGISPTELAEYEAAETKYTSRPLDLSHTMTKPEEKRLEYLFQHMSLAQQQHRMIIFDYPPAPQKGSAVSKHELASWADPAVYGIWLDNKRLKNSELKHLNPKNINQIFFSRLTDVAVKNDGFHYQIELMTLPYYKKYRVDAIANRNNSMIIFHMKS